MGVGCTFGYCQASEASMAFPRSFRLIALVFPSNLYPVLISPARRCCSNTEISLLYAYSRIVIWLLDILYEDKKRETLFPS